jgi:hypothetical protein
MRSIQRFAAAHPLPFVILATVVWIGAAGVAAFLAASALQAPMTDLLPQSLGALAATTCLLVMMWRWGWLPAAGVTVLGSRRLWLVTAGLAVYVVVAGLWLLLCTVPGSIPTERREWGAVTVERDQFLQGMDAPLEATIRHIEKQGAK